VSKRLTSFLLFCLLCLSTLSNSFFSLRQFLVGPDSVIGFHVQADNVTPFQFEGSIVVGSASEDMTHLEPIPGPAIRPEASAADNLNQNSRRFSRLQTDRSSRPPTYIVQSVLNL
jgi:hypothetical protein